MRGFLAYDRLLEARPGLRGRVVFVAMVYPSRQALPEYLAYANEIEQVVERVNDRWATRDWTADRARPARRLPAIDRRHAALRRVVREPDQGRAEPRRQGRPAAQPARRVAVPLTRGRRVRRAAAAVHPAAPVRPRADGGRARRRARDPARRACRRRDAACASSRRRRHPPTWLDDLVAHARCIGHGACPRQHGLQQVQQTRRARRRGRRPRPASSGGISGETHADADGADEPPSSTARRERGERGEVARCRRPRTRRRR